MHAGASIESSNDFYFAKELMEESLTLHTEVFGPIDNKTITTQWMLGQLLYHLREYTKGSKLLQDALQKYIQIKGLEHEETQNLRAYMNEKGIEIK